jgi:hypothetical protein
MNLGFNKPKVVLNTDELNKIIRKYKKVKKYMKSPIYNIKTMDGNESYVSGLINEAKEDPPV